jgi:hypothetical protein
MKEHFDTIAFVAGFLLFFAMLFGLAMNSNSNTHECHVKAIEKGMGATDILAVCGR